MESDGRSRVFVRLMTSEGKRGRSERDAAVVTFVCTLALRQTACGEEERAEKSVRSRAWVRRTRRACACGEERAR